MRRKATTPSRSPEQGVFAIFWKEHRIGETRSRLTKDGYRSVTRVEVAGQLVETTIDIKTDDEGYCRSVRIVHGAKTVETKRRPGQRKIVFFDAYSPAVVSPLVRRMRTREVRTQALLATGHVVTLAIKRTGRRGRLYVYSGRAAEWYFELLADAQGRVVLLHSRADELHVVRRTHASLVTLADAGQIRAKQNIRVPMRDGIDLATDIYLPSREPRQRWPAILIRTPYDKRLEEPEARYYAARGYAVAVQDVRGRLGSEGVFEPFVNEANDGVDSVAWLAAQRWCVGKVGMVGGSYLGLAQLQTAAKRPPALAAIVPSFAPPGPLSNIPYDHGCLALAWGLWWLALLDEKARTDMHARKLTPEQLESLPVAELDGAAFGRKNSVWRKWLKTAPGNSYWRKAEYLDKLHTTTAAALHITGWFDGTRMGAIRSFCALQRAGAPPQRLIIGPWLHGVLTRTVAEHDFGPEAILDLQSESVKWLDTHLAGREQDESPCVSLFVMGRNQWVHGSKYPLEETEQKRWYLGGRAASAMAGTLTRRSQSALSEPDRYTYDPAAVSVEGDGGENGFHPHPGVLRYATRPFRAPYTVAGPLSLWFYASSSARDTDWHVTLAAMDEDKHAFTLSHGCLRARYRESLYEPRLLRPGQVCRYRIELWDTAIRFAAGWRMVLTVSSALFPSYSRNLNTGASNERETRTVVARQAVYHDEHRPSYLTVSRLSEP